MTLRFPITIIGISLLIFGTLFLVDEVQNSHKRCPETIFINESAFPLDRFDKEVALRTQISCGFQNRRQSCLIEFRKLGPMSYSHICGPKQ